MREILFRAKRQNGEWREGSLLFYPDVNRAFISSGDYSSIGGIVEVDKKTVGQYTGLTDKNGKRIFEGDILDTTNSNSRIWYVDYKKTAFCCNQGNANYSCELDDFMRYSDVEVIGSIHDNPELLEVSGDG